MLTFETIKNVIDDINSITFFELYISEYKNDNYYIYKLNINKKYYYINMKKNSTTNDEKILLKVLIEEKIKSQINTKNYSKDKLLKKILNNNLDDKEEKTCIQRLDFTHDKSIVCIVVKVYNEDRTDDIMSIVENINKGNIISKIKENLIVMFIDYKLKDALNLSKTILETIEAETLERVKIGIGNSETSINLKNTYNQSVASIEIAETFKLSGDIHSYNSLLLHRILSKLSQKEFQNIKSDISNYRLQKLDNEDIKTANIFISSNLNISEASRKLYIHRNTLIYRLDKINKKTNLDLKNFEDALKFKILLMISRYNELT